MLLSVKRREVYSAYVRLNVDSFQVVLRKSIYTFIQRLLKSNNCLISNIVTSMSLQCHFNVVYIWKYSIYTVDDDALQVLRFKLHLLCNF